MQPRSTMKILALGPQNVYPPVDGGKEGIFGAIRALARLCDLTFAFPGGPGGADTSGYAEAGVRALAVRWQPAESAGLILSASARLRPFKFEKYATDAAVAAFADTLAGVRFDAIICFHAHTWRLAHRLCRRLGLQIPILVREHNIEYEIVASYRSLLRPAARLATLPVELLTRREERRIWERADAVAFLSDHDLQVARDSKAGGRLTLAREGVPIPPRRLAAAPAAGAPLLVLLNPNAPQGVANLRDFLVRYWSPARQDSRLSVTTLHVTGATTARLAALVGMDEVRLEELGVRGLGFLDSLAPCFAASLALLSPTFTGGGIRKKILEAMANQLPVIATSLDIASSSYFEPGRNLLAMGEDAQSLAAAVAELGDGARWCALADAGRATVESYASWEQCAEALVAELHHLLARAAQPARAAA